MILTGPEIARQVREGGIVIDPFDPEQVNPNSYNFRLGRTVRVYSRFPVDPRIPNPYDEVEIPDDGLLLDANRLYLGHTKEVLGGVHFAPTFSARSSVARLGLFINLSASLGDIGYIGQWTLQLYATHPIRVYAGMRIGQMMWWCPRGEISLYEGKYQGSRGPKSTLIHRDLDPPEPNKRLPALEDAPSAAIVGSKFATLARASHLARVPPAFAIPASWFSDALGEQRRVQLEQIVSRLRATVGAFVVPAAEAAEQAMCDLVVPDDLQARIRSRMIEVFGASHGIRLAVRSSGRDEDGHHQSLAGIYDSQLDADGFEGVISGIVRCWKAAYGPRALAARARSGVFDSAPTLSVFVQRMVDAEFSGVAFSAASAIIGAGSRPLSGSVEQSGVDVVIEYVEGSGEQLVSGAVTPGRLTGDSDPNRPMPAWARDVRELARELHRDFGHPVDVEWAWSAGVVWLLQVRPVTAQLTENVALSSQFRFTDLYTDTLAPGFELGDVASVYAQYVRKRGPAFEIARTTGAGVGPAFLLNFTSDALESASALEFQQILTDGPGAEVVIDLGENVRQVIVLSRDSLGTLRSLLPATGPELRTAVVRNFIRGELGFISRRIESGLLVEYSSDGLLAINRGISTTHRIELRDNAGSVAAVEGGQDVQSLVASLDVIDATTAAMAQAFGGVQLEWVLHGSEPYFVDFSLEREPPLAPTTSDGELTIVNGSARGVVVVLDDDALLEELSVGPAVSIGKEANILPSDIRSLLDRLENRSSPAIVFARRPYAVLSLLIGRVEGFVFEEGSLLCHLAILLREANVPALVSKDVREGDEVLLSNGTVEVLRARPSGSTP